MRERELDMARERALEEKMSRGLQAAVAELAEVLIGPTATLQAVRAPQPVLEQKPDKDLDASRCPRLPHSGRRNGTDAARELDVVCRFGGVAAVLGEYPANRVIDGRRQGGAAQENLAPHFEEGGEQRGGDGGGQQQVRDPTVISQGLDHRLVLPPGDPKD